MTKEGFKKNCKKYECYIKGLEEDLEAALNAVSLAKMFGDEIMRRACEKEVVEINSTLVGFITSYEVFKQNYKHFEEESK